MKHVSVLFLLIAILIASCTKEVPETERRQSKSVEEMNIKRTVENFITAYNDGDIETATQLLDVNYKELTSDSLDVIGIESAKKELLDYKRQYPEGKWELKIEEVIVSDGYAYIVCNGSFMMPDPVGKNMSPIHSERSIRILRKDKNSGWKIFRYLSASTFTYDEK